MTWSICIKHSTETKHNINIENRVKQQSIEMAEETSTAETKKKRTNTAEQRTRHSRAQRRHKHSRAQNKNYTNIAAVTQNTNTAEHNNRAEAMQPIHTLQSTERV